MKASFNFLILFFLFLLFISDSVLSADVKYAFIASYDNIESIEDDDEKVGIQVLKSSLAI